MVTKVGLLVEKLQGIYNRAISYDTPRSFFLMLFEFVEEYDENPLLEPVGKKIVEIGKELLMMSMTGFISLSVNK